MFFLSIFHFNVKKYKNRFSSLQQICSLTTDNEKFTCIALFEQNILFIYLFIYFKLHEKSKL